MQAKRGGTVRDIGRWPFVALCLDILRGGGKCGILGRVLDQWTETNLEVWLHSAQGQVPLAPCGAPKCCQSEAAGTC